MSIVTEIISAVVSLFEWAVGLNSWQLTFFACAGVLAWFAAFALIQRFMSGGYAGDKTEDDEEDAP
jgi:type IV secretory pathway VirB2 component (pilin)